MQTKPVHTRAVPLVSSMQRAAPWLSLVLLLAFASPAHAEREHRVRGGQTLGAIAKRYGITVWSLAAANRLDPEAKVRKGQILTVPDRGVVFVNEGQTLWSIARRHDTTPKAIARANRIAVDKALKPGTRLILPGYAPGKGKGKGGRGWGSPKKHGRVTFYRVANKKKLTVTLVNRNGRVRKAAVEQLARFLRPRNSRRWRRPPRRLVALLAKASDHFGGRTLHVVSGYRKAGGYTGRESRHTDGAAIDFRIKGVPNSALRDYLRRFERVGVGYYPNSTFVHLDVRKTKAYWVDVSRPGARPRYVAPSEFQNQRKAHAQAGSGGASNSAATAQAAAPSAPSEAAAAGAAAALDLSDL